MGKYNNNNNNSRSELWVRTYPGLLVNFLVVKIFKTRVNAYMGDQIIIIIIAREASGRYVYRFYPILIRIMVLVNSD